MTSPPSSYRLPDLCSLCPWKAAFNPHYEETSVSASKWVLNYASDAVPSKDRLDFFEKKGCELLAAWVWPYASREQLRVCCDFLNIVFVIDEVSDRQDGKEAKETAATVMNTLKDEKYDDGTVLCNMVKDFAQRFLPHSGHITVRRFIQHMESYLEAVTQEAELREERTTLDLASYDSTRRENSGAALSFQLFGYLFGVDLPDEVYHHPVFAEMHFAAVDMITWANDVYSYKIEAKRGLADNNILTILQKEKHMSLQQASDYVGTHFKQLVHVFEMGKSRIPSFNEELDQAVLQYFIGMECWVTGNIEWSFDTVRYLGEERAQVKKTLVVELSA